MIYATIGALTVASVAIVIFLSSIFKSAVDEQTKDFDKEDLSMFKK